MDMVCCLCKDMGKMLPAKLWLAWLVALAKLGVCCGANSVGVLACGCCVFGCMLGCVFGCMLGCGCCMFSCGCGCCMFSCGCTFCYGVSREGCPCDAWGIFWAGMFNPKD